MESVLDLHDTAVSGPLARSSGLDGLAVAVPAFYEVTVWFKGPGRLAGRLVVDEIIAWYC